MVSTRFSVRAALAVTIAFALLATPLAQAEDAVAEWAPENALLFIGVPNCDGLQEAAKKTQAYRSLEDPALKETIQPWKKLIENVQNYVAKELGLENPKELEIWPHGGIAAFLTVDMPTGEDQEEEAHLCIVAEMGKDADRARTIAAKIVEQSLKNGGERSTEEAGGTEITTIKFKADKKDGDDNAEGSEEEPEDDTDSSLEGLLEGVELDEMQMAIATQVLGSLEAPESFAFAFAGTRLVAGSDTAIVKETMLRLRRGAEGTLAANKDLRAFGRRDFGKVDALMMFNLPVLMEGLSKQEEEAKKAFTALSTEALGPLIFAAQIAPSKDIDVKMRGFMRIDSRPHGLGRILMMENIETAPPAGVPADSALYASINLNPQLILEEVLAIAEQINPETAEQMQGSMKIPQEDGSTLDIKTDVVGQITGPLTVGLNLAKPFDAEHVNMIVRLGHRSRDAMTKLAALLPAGTFMPSEMMGHTVYKTPMLEGMAMGFTERAIIPFATQKALESYIRSEGQSDRGLAQTPGFQRVARHVPARSCAMLYVNGPLIADAQIALAEEGPESPAMESGEANLPNYIRWGMSESSSGQDVDMLKATRKYQSYAIMTMSTESDGLLFDLVQVPAGEETGQ